VHRSTVNWEVARAALPAGIARLGGSEHGGSPWCDEEEEGAEGVLTMGVLGRQSDGIRTVASSKSGGLMSSAGRSSGSGDGERSGALYTVEEGQGGGAIYRAEEGRGRGGSSFLCTGGQRERRAGAAHGDDAAS
jgi:hypothetical protein